MTREQAIDKARKLLALATSDNEHEAALAAAAAERILARHELGLDALEVPEDEQPEDADEECQRWDDPLPGSGSASWRGVLALGIARAHGCFAFRDHGRIYLIGRAANVATVRYIDAWMVREVDRLAHARRGNGRAWINAYRHGAVGAILGAIRGARAAEVAGARQTADAAGDARALVRIDTAVSRVAQRRAEAETWGRANLRLGGARRVSVGSADGYSVGRRDGAGVYGRGHGQLGAGQARLRG